MRKNQFSIKNSPQMLEELKNFVENVKTFLFYHENRENYAVKTYYTKEGLDLILMAEISHEQWRYVGRHFNNELLARSASFMYHGAVALKIKQTSEQITSSHRGAINECLKFALTLFTDINHPWQEHSYLSKNNLQCVTKIIPKRRSKIDLRIIIRDLTGMEVYRTRYTIKFM